MKLRLTLAFLAVLHAFVVLAAFFAPYDYAEQHRDYPFAPPTRVHFTDAAGRFHLRPFVYGITQDLPGGDYREDRGRRYPVGFLCPRPALRRRRAGRPLSLGQRWLWPRRLLARPLWRPDLAAHRLGRRLPLALPGTPMGYSRRLPWRLGGSPPDARRGALPGASLALSVAGRARFPAAAHFHDPGVLPAGGDYRHRGLGAARAHGSRCRPQRPRTRLRPGRPRVRRLRPGISSAATSSRLPGAWF